MCRDDSAKMATPACGDKHQEALVCGAAEQNCVFSPSNPDSRDEGLGIKGRLTSETSYHPEPK